MKIDFHKHFIDILEECIVFLEESIDFLKELSFGLPDRIPKLLSKLCFPSTAPEGPYLETNKQLLKFRNKLMGSFWNLLVSKRNSLSGDYCLFHCLVWS